MIDVLQDFKQLVSNGYFCIHPHSWLIAQAKGRTLPYDSDIRFGNIEYKGKKFRRGISLDTLKKIEKNGKENFYLCDKNTAEVYNREMKAMGMNEHSINCTFEEMYSEFESEIYLGSGCRADLISKSLIIEVKKLNAWKHALGQVLSYRYHKPNHKCVILLFGKPEIPQYIADINIICSYYDVAVHYLSTGSKNNTVLAEVYRLSNTFD